MPDPNIKEDLYEKRKATAIQALHFQWKFNREKYLDFLAIFIELFTNH